MHDHNDWFYNASELFACVHIVYLNYYVFSTEILGSLATFLVKDYGSQNSRKGSPVHLTQRILLVIQYGFIS